MNKLILKKINTIEKNVEEINQLLDELHLDHVEVRIAYKESSNGNAPAISLWKAVEHVDYLKKENNNQV
jgi:wyosine [tRNA(Phe)-imidazoG37] synthetase (radical SAM superfamily)